MTSTTHNGVYVFGKPKANVKVQTKADARRIAEAKKRIAKYVKK